MPCLDFSPPTDTAPRLAWPALARPLAALVWMAMVSPLTMAASAAAAAPAETELLVRARAWLAQAYQVNPGAVTVQAPDARLQAGPCAGGWT